MLRTSLALSRAGFATRAGRQWVANGAVLRRSFADKPSISDSKPIVLPGSASPSTNEPLPQGPVKTSESSTVKETAATPATPSTPIIPPENIPRMPTGPSKVQAAPPTSIPDAPPKPKVSSSPTPPPPPPGPVKPPRRIIRTILTSLLILSILGFGGGVYYSRINDTFHDFFTEWVPYGEEAILYLEERDFRKRFPGIAARASKPRDTGSKVTIPSQSGVSWKLAEEDKSQDKPKPSEGLKDLHVVPHVERVAAVEQVKKEPTLVKPVEKKPEPETPKETPVTPSEKSVKPSEKNVKASEKKSRAPQVDEPSVWPTEIAPIEPLRLRGPDPVIEDLAKIVNDIILVINADASNLNENVKYSSTIEKSKQEIRKVAQQIIGLKKEAENSADEKIQEIHRQFDDGAKNLIQRLQEEMQDHETRWKSEFESERQKIQDAYESKLKAEIEKQEELNKQKLENQLLEQALALQKHFVSEVKSHVEEERDGRLGKLSELKGEIAELEKLTTEWNQVLDANLKTQHLHVAVEAVRAKLEESSTIPRPFIRELAALKEIANGDAVVDAAIASINPVAYQKGIPNSAQLIDRFRRVAGEVRKASLLPDEAGVASHASSYVLSKVMFRKSGGGVPDGDDVESVLARTEMLLEEGDLDNAAREMTTLKGWAARLSSDWLAECRKVLEVRQALDVIATEARLESLRVE